MSGVWSSVLILVVRSDLFHVVLTVRESCSAILKCCLGPVFFRDIEVVGSLGLRQSLQGKSWVVRYDGEMFKLGLCR